VCRPDDVKDSSKSATNESVTSRSSTATSQRHKQTPASKHSADTSSCAGAVHEEWETASESSDVLKDSDSRQQPQSARTRRDSKRGYSNQRHTQSRRGRYRDRPSADVTVAETGYGGAVGVDARMTRTNTASVSSASNSGRHGDTTGPNGNVHAVYRLDQVVFDDPVAIRAAFSDVFVRCV